MSGRGRHASWIGALLTLAALPACGALLDPAANRCEADADCSAGTCDVERAMCVAEARTPLRVGLEVVPTADPFGGTAVPVSFPPFDLEGAREGEELSLPVGVPTTGLVRDRLTGEAVTADVTLTLASEFPGGASVAITAQSRAETSEDTRDGYRFNFATQVLPGRRYQLTARPNGEWLSKRPPIRIGPRWESPPGGSARIDYLEYPDFCPQSIELEPSSECLIELEGVVVDTAGVGQDGMLVRVVHSVGGRVLSSTYTTGSDPDPDLTPGYFRVVLFARDWLDSEGWLFSVTPSAARVEAAGPSPRFTVDPSGLYQDETGRITILTPDVASVVTYAGWVETAHTSEPLGGASMTFTSRDVVDSATGVVGTFTSTTTSSTDPDDTGRFEVQLLPGTYDVVVTPPEVPRTLEGDSGLADLAVLRMQVTIQRDVAMGQLFAVPRQVRFGGTVRTSTGVGMLNAAVRAQARGSDLAGALDPVALYARSEDTRTDAEGIFRLGLDVGVYDIVVQPPAGSNYPWLVDVEQPFGGSEAALTREYELDNPVVVSGRATFDASGEATPVAMGRVRAYAVLDAGGGARAIQIGEATTDEEGNYTLLLPRGL